MIKPKQSKHTLEKTSTAISSGDSVGKFEAKPVPELLLPVSNNTSIATIRSKEIIKNETLDISFPFTFAFHLEVRSAAHLCLTKALQIVKIVDVLRCNLISLWLERWCVIASKLAKCLALSQCKSTKFKGYSQIFAGV